jgi:VWFA-related protein
VAGPAPGIVLVGAALAAAVAGLPAAGQEAPRQARPVFRSGVTYVAVDAVVTDKHGKPVTDLTARDFEIRDAGRPQAILDFDRVLVPVTHRKVDLHATPAPPPDVASNPRPTPASRGFVFVIDDGAIRTEDIIPLKRAMTDFLQTLGPDDRAAVVYIKRSDLAQDFTTDIGSLVRAVNHIDAALGWDPDARASRLVLDNVVASLAEGPETRRVVVYVSSGFPIEPCAALDLLECTPPVPPRNDAFTYAGLTDLFERARRADVPIYAIDPHGVYAPDLGFSGHLEDQTPERRMLLDRTSLAKQGFMRTVAANTHGLAFVNASDVGSAVNAIMTDNSCYYVLGYSPTPYRADGKFHPIEVKVVTRPGLQVRARPGYVASAALPAEDAHARLLGALGDGQPHADLPLRAFAAPVVETATGATSVVTLDVSYPAADGDQTRADDDLQVAYVAVDSDGDVLKSEPHAFYVVLGRAPRGAFRLSLDDALDLPKGRFTLRIGVSSRMLGTVGTVHLPLEVRGPAGDRPEASPLVLGVAGRVANPVGHADSIAALVPFQPTTARTFTEDQQLRIFSRVFTSSGEGVTPELRLERDGTVVHTIDVTVHATPSLEEAVDCEALVPLADLPAGAYMLTFAVGRASDRGAVQSVGFTVR